MARDKASLEPEAGLRTVNPFWGDTGLDPSPTADSTLITVDSTLHTVDAD